MDKLSAEEIKNTIERRVGVSPEQVTESSLRDAGCWNRVCVLPEQFNERASYLGDVLVQMLCKSSKTVTDDNLRSIVGQLCQSLSYMINSCSWREGQMHDFDLAEIQRKLRRFVPAPAHVSESEDS